MKKFTALLLLVCLVTCLFANLSVSFASDLNDDTNMGNNYSTVEQILSEINNANFRIAWDSYDYPYYTFVKSPNGKWFGMQSSIPLCVDSKVNNSYPRHGNMYIHTSSITVFSFYGIDDNVAYGDNSSCSYTASYCDSGWYRVIPKPGLDLNGLQKSSNFDVNCTYQFGYGVLMYDYDFEVYTNYDIYEVQTGNKVAVSNLYDDGSVIGLSHSVVDIGANKYYQVAWTGTPTYSDYASVSVRMLVTYSGGSFTYQYNFSSGQYLSGNMLQVSVNIIYNAIVRYSGQSKSTFSDVSVNNFVIEFTSYALGESCSYAYSGASVSLTTGEMIYDDVLDSTYIDTQPDIADSGYFVSEDNYYHEYYCNIVQDAYYESTALISSENIGSFMDSLDAGGFTYCGYIYEESNAISLDLISGFNWFCFDVGLRFLDENFSYLIESEDGNYIDYSKLAQYDVIFAIDVGHYNEWVVVYNDTYYFKKMLLSEFESQKQVNSIQNMLSDVYSLDYKMYQLQYNQYNLLYNQFGDIVAGIAQINTYLNASALYQTNVLTAFTSLENKLDASLQNDIDIGNDISAALGDLNLSIEDINTYNDNQFDFDVGFDSLIDAINNISLSSGGGGGSSVIDFDLDFYTWDDIESLLPDWLVDVKDWGYSVFGLGDGSLIDGVSGFIDCYIGTDGLLPALDSDGDGILIDEIDGG